MFKVVILQSLYNLSDEQASSRFGIASRLCDFWTCLWEMTFRTPRRFETYLCEQGFSARKGQIVDASIIPVPKQRNRRGENRRIKEGEIPEDWNEQKKRQKDTDARWMKKDGQNHYGYKNHIDVDVKPVVSQRYVEKSL